MTELVQFLVGGLVVGSIYGLAAIGYTGVYNVTGVINFAQGDMAMFGAMTAIAFFAVGLDQTSAIALAILAAGLLGAGIDRVAIQPLKGNVVRAVIVTIGIGVALQGVVVVIWGTEAKTLPPFSSEAPLRFLGATIPPHSLWVLATAALLMLVLALFFQLTYIGKAFRACAVNPFAARLAGIEVSAMGTIAFVLSGILGAIAGIIVAPITLMQYDTGVAIGLKGFVACIIGGLGNPIGAMLGGLLLGVVEAFSAGFLSSGYKNAIAFVLMLAFLLFRPGGLLGELERTGR